MIKAYPDLVDAKDSDEKELFEPDQLRELLKVSCAGQKRKRT